MEWVNDDVIQVTKVSVFMVFAHKHVFKNASDIALTCFAQETVKTFAYIEVAMNHLVNDVIPTYSKFI